MKIVKSEYPWYDEVILDNDDIKKMQEYKKPRMKFYKRLWEWSSVTEAIFTLRTYFNIFDFSITIPLWKVKKYFCYITKNKKFNSTKYLSISFSNDNKYFISVFTCIY